MKNMSKINCISKMKSVTKNSLPIVSQKAVYEGRKVIDFQHVAINFDEQQVNCKCYDRTQQKHFVIKD